MTRQPLRPLVCLVLGLLALSAALTAQPQPAATQPVTVATVVAPGTVAAFYSADLYAKESGYVLEVVKDIGDHVEKGQTLAILDDPELKQQAIAADAIAAARNQMVKAADASLAQSKAALEVVKKQLAGLEADQKLTQETLKRQEELFAGKAITVQQLDEMRAKAQVAGAAADVGRAKISAADADVQTAAANRAVAAAQERVAAAEVERLKTLVEYLKIVAPFDGVITRRWVNPGDLAQAGTGARTTPLFTCQKIDTVRVFCEVPEASVAAVRPGIAAEVKLYGAGGAVVHGTVTRIATALDASTRTMRAEIDLPNPHEILRPGMYAQVTLTPESSGPK
jgi:multidrug efflux pump subunit AcrA (membrane-fusion protein)